MLNIFSPSLVIELICLLFSLVFLINDKSRFWRIALLYIILMCITEIAAKYSGKIYRSNVVVYNVYTFFEASFILYAFNYFLKEYIDIGKWLLATYILIITIYFTHNFIYGITTYNAVTVSVMSVFFVVYALLYFYLLLKDENYVDLKFHPAFWWTGGTLIFYFGSTLANFFDDIIQMKFSGNLNARIIIYTTLNAFLYGFWIYSFICRARQRKLCL